jgi:hypothetical protein
MMKQLGLLKKKSKLPFGEWLKEVSKNIQMGKEIHRQKTEEMMRRADEQEAAKNSPL